MNDISDQTKRQLTVVLSEQKYANNIRYHDCNTCEITWMLLVSITELYIDLGELPCFS